MTKRKARTVRLVRCMDCGLRHVADDARGCPACYQKMKRKVIGLRSGRRKP